MMQIYVHIVMFLMTFKANVLFVRFIVFYKSSDTFLGNYSNLARCNYFWLTICTSIYIINVVSLIGIDNV